MHSCIVDQRTHTVSHTEMIDTARHFPQLLRLPQRLVVYLSWPVRSMNFQQIEMVLVHRQQCSDIQQEGSSCAVEHMVQVQTVQARPVAVTDGHSRASCVWEQQTLDPGNAHCPLRTDLTCLVRWQFPRATTSRASLLYCAGIIP